MALKSGISGISRRPATEPDVAGSTEPTPRDRLMRRAGIAEAAADSAAPQRVDTIEEQEEIEAEEEAEQGEQLVMLKEDFVPEEGEEPKPAEDRPMTMNPLLGAGYGKAEEPESEFKPEPVGRGRGRPKAKPPEDDAKAPGLSIVELRAEIKGLEMEFKDISVAQKELDARKGDAFERYNTLTGQLAMALVGG